MRSSSPELLASPHGTGALQALPFQQSSVSCIGLALAKAHTPASAHRSIRTAGTLFENDSKVSQQLLPPKRCPPVKHFKSPPSPNTRSRHRPLQKSTLSRRAAPLLKASGVHHFSPPRPTTPARTHPHTTLKPSPVTTPSPPPARPSHPITPSPSVSRSLTTRTNRRGGRVVSDAEQRDARETDAHKPRARAKNRRADATASSEAT